MERVICLLFGYLIGLFQSAYIFGRLFRNIDIRNMGSGNAGTTNAFRVMGKKAGVIVFLGDFFKVIIACMLGNYLFGFAYEYICVYAGAGCILGHIFPFYMDFKGGKGIACLLGLMLYLCPLAALITYIVGIIVFKLKKYVSLSSLVMAVVYPVVMIIFMAAGIIEKSAEVIVIMFLIAALTYYKHYENIKRLLNGTENKFSVKKR